MCEKRQHDKQASSLASNWIGYLFSCRGKTYSNNSERHAASTSLAWNEKYNSIIGDDVGCFGRAGGCLLDKNWLWWRRQVCVV